MGSAELKRCLELLSDVMELGCPSRFDSLPLEALCIEELDELALAIKARSLAELPSAMAEKIESQRREESRLYKEKVQRADEKYKALKRLVRYAGPEMARKGEGLDEIKFEIASKGGGPPNLGVLGYVLDLVERADGPVDPYEIAEKVLIVFPDRYRSDEYKWRPELVRSLGQQLIERAFAWREKVAPIEEEISKALQEEKTAARYIKAAARLRFPKTTPLYEAVKRIGGGSLLEKYESSDLHIRDHSEV